MNYVLPMNLFHICVLKAFYTKQHRRHDYSSPLFPQLKFIVKRMGIVYIKCLERKSITIKQPRYVFTQHFFFSRFGVLMGEITHRRQTRWFLVICPDGYENTFQNKSVYRWYH